MSEMEHIECTPSVLAFPVGEGLVRACRDTFAQPCAPWCSPAVLPAMRPATRSVKPCVLQSDVEAMVVLQDGAALPSRHSSEALCQLAQSYLADRG